MSADAAAAAGATRNGSPARAQFVVVTPARDEAARLPGLLDAVAAQSRPPDRWVIVDDGSTDGTAAVLAAAAHRLPFLEVVTVTRDGPRSFAGKVDAFDVGWQHARSPDVDYLACIDADVLPPPDLFERALDAFAADPQLGVTGARYIQRVGRRWEPDLGPDHQPPGGAQFFRREVYEAIGGFQRLPYGGEDTLANVSARSLGWRASMLDGVFVRHRRGDRDVGLRRAVAVQARQGRLDHDIGTPAVVEVARLSRRLRDRPWVLGATVRLAAYTLARVRRLPRHASPESIAAWRADQWSRFPGVRRLAGGDSATSNGIHSNGIHSNGIHSNGSNSNGASG